MITTIPERRPFDMPTSLAKLLKAAGLEQREPETVGGMLYGSLAYLFVGIATQFPDQWPAFRALFIEATDDLRDVLTSANPEATVAGMRARQRRDQVLADRMDVSGELNGAAITAPSSTGDE